jgi:hypothetical protein
VESAPAQRIRGQRLFVLALGALVLLFGAVASIAGRQTAWELAGVPALTPRFADLRTIAGCRVSVLRGKDPMVENPGDPWGRPLNYPRIWQSLCGVSLGDREVDLVGALFAVIFLAGVLYFPRAQLGTGAVTLLLAAVASPAVLLGVERGNTDLLIFALCAAAAALVAERPGAAAASLLVGFVLKLYPAAGLVALTGVRRRRSALAAIALVVIAVYLAVSGRDLGLIRRGTPRTPVMSYGRDVAPLWAELLLPRLAPGVRLASVFLAAAVVLTGVVVAARGALVAHGARSRPAAWPDVHAFRIGAAIFAGTFVLGTNHEYRLMFLVLAIPQLFAWARGRGLTGVIAGGTLAASLLRMWMSGSSAPWLPLGVRVIAGAAAEWTIFAGVVLLLASTLRVQIDSMPQRS